MTSCDATHPQFHAITLAIATTITRNTSPPMAPPIIAPTFCSSEDSFSFLLAALVDSGVLVDEEGGLMVVTGDDLVL